MYTPAQFVETRPEVLQTFIREHQFAAIVTPTSDDLEADHVPVLFESSQSAVNTLQGHIARANPIWRKVTNGAKALVIFQGVNHYVSPSWHPSKKEHGKVVPTWNYVVVHVRGYLTWQHDRSWLRALLDRTTDIFERDRSASWKVSDAPGDYIDKMLGSIVGFEISIDSMIGKWKLSQNRSTEEYAGVAAGLVSEKTAEATEMVEWMHESKSS